MNTGVLIVTLNTTLNQVTIIQTRTVKECTHTDILLAITCMRLSLEILKLNTMGRRMEIPWRTIRTPIIRFRKIISMCLIDTIPMHIILSRTTNIRIIILRAIIGTSVMVVVAITVTITTIRRTMIILRRDMVRKRIKGDFWTGCGILEGNEA